MQHISQIHRHTQVWRAAGVICGASVCAGDGFSFHPDFRGHPYRFILTQLGKKTESVSCY